MKTTSARRVLCLAGAALATGFGLGAADARAAAGDLTLPAGPAACLHPAALEGCGDSRGDDAVSPYAFSPDGRQLYGGSLDGLLVLDRSADGSVTPRAGADGCYVAVAVDGCTGVTGQDNATDVAVSPDGQHVYATSSFSDSIVIYDRAPDGSLSRKPANAGCIAEEASFGCADGRALDVAAAVEISADGEHVYVLSQGTNDGIAVFDRAPDGTLTQKGGAAGCITQAGGDGCTNGRGLLNPNELVLRGDDLYATGPGIASFDLAADGTVVQKAGTDACISNSGSDGCATGRGLSTVVGLAITPDGARAYAAGQGSSAITTFDRAGDGRLTQRPDATSCVVHDGAPAIAGCVTGRGLETVKSPALSPDGTQLYASTQGSDGVVVLDVAADGTPIQRPGARGCITQAPVADCGGGRGLGSANQTLVDPEGRKVHVGATALVTFDRQVGPDPVVPPAAEPTPGPVPASTPSATPTPGPARPVVPVALCNRSLTLLDVLPSGRRRVRVSGLARTTFAGRRVVIREGGRRVGTAVVARDGRFAVRVAAPSKARRAKVRYTATLPDGTRSQAFKLQRSFTILSRKETKSGIRLVVRLNGRDRSREVRVQRQTSCTQRRNVATRRIDAEGRVTFVLPRPTDPADPVAIYRVRARVGKQLSFTLQVAVERAG